MPVWQGKKYKLVSNENSDAYLAALGVNIVERKVINLAKPTVELLKQGDEYILKTVAALKTSSIKFKPGEEFDEETAGGRSAKSICTFEGDNKLIQEIIGDKPVKVIREFTSDSLNVTLTVGDIVCKRVYKAT